MRTHNAGRLLDLADDQRHVFSGDSTHIHLDVQEIVRGEFGNEPPRNNIEVLETFNDARDRAGISVRAFGAEGARVTIGDQESNDAFLAVARAYPRHR